jgi:hypothetical protein
LVVSNLHPSLTPAGVLAKTAGAATRHSAAGDSKLRLI